MLASAIRIYAALKSDIRALIASDDRFREIAIKARLERGTVMIGEIFLYGFDV